METTGAAANDPNPEFTKKFQETIQAYADSTEAGKDDEAQMAALSALLMAAEEGIKNPTPELILKQKADDLENQCEWVEAEKVRREILSMEENMEEKTGLPLVQLAEKNRGVRVGYKDLQAHPHRLLNSPMWSGVTENGRAYSAFTYNKENLVPWRTLTGRQHFYLDHPGYLQFGEHLPTYKPKPSAVQYADLRLSKAEGPTLMLNYLTPHGKWHIHSTYGDNHRMTTLSRGVEPFWMNDRDAAEIGIEDNDWVEVHNDNGVVVTRAAVSARIPRGISIQYHSPERTYSVPKSPIRNFRRAGGHNSLTRVRLKPNLMVGGYGQFTFHFNYWGPTGCNRDTHILVRKLPELKW